MALLAGGLAPPLLAASLPTLSVLAFLAGLPIAPAVTGAYGLIDAVARRGTAAEAFAWIGTAVSVGIAAGTAAGGMLVESFGVDASFGFACAAAVAGAALVAAAPGLRGR